tara:strand:+ start:1080 stop:1526 length:447 start_codon:yes stop_codon:yes gene_type:complete
MAGWIAAAVVGTSIYTASEARAARSEAERQQKKALAAQEIQAAAMRGEVAKQTAEFSKQSASLQQQANLAKEQFAASQSQYAESKLAMDAKAREIQAAADEERRKSAMQEASALKARTRGGRRSLLSQERMNPELGISAGQLGTGMMV